MTDRTSLGIGILFENLDADRLRSTVFHNARAAEAAGIESIWISDHVVMPTNVATAYPFSEDGHLPWSLDDPWYDPMIWLTALAVSTNHVEIGTNAMVVGLRNPLELAKQIATLDQISSGRFILGAAAGWLLEEFEALDVPAGGRGQRLDEWIQILHKAETGMLDSLTGQHFRLAAPVYMRPTPMRPVPVLIAGMSRAALKRVARHCAGWIAEVKSGDDPIAVINSGVRQIKEFGGQLGHSYATVPRVVYNAGEPLDILLRRLDSLLAVGVTDIVIPESNVDLEDLSTVIRQIRAG